MAGVLVYHVVGDLTIGKPVLSEFPESESLDSAVRAIADCSEGAIAVWRARSADSSALESSPVSRFVGMLSALDVVAFLAKSIAWGVATGEAHEKLMRTPVSEVVVPNPSLIREVDPATRLIDALDMMKQGVRRLLVRKSGAWKGFSKHFSVIYNGKWLKNIELTARDSGSNIGEPSSSSVVPGDKFCCLSREDVVRFLIGCLGSLAPIPLTSISSLGAINPQHAHVEAPCSALDAIEKIPQDPCAIAVVESLSEGGYKMIGDISAYKLSKCDYFASAWALANLSAGQFVVGSNENGKSPASSPDVSLATTIEESATGASPRAKKFSSRSIGFFSNQANQMAFGRQRSMHRGRSMPLMCRNTSTLAAIMAQMLSHRATHVWVTDVDSEDGALVGVVAYTDILNAVTKTVPSVPT